MISTANLSQYGQPPKSTQPGHPSVGKRNKYQNKGGDALRLGSKGRYGSWQVKLCDPLTNTDGPYLNIFSVINVGGGMCSSECV